MLSVKYLLILLPLSVYFLTGCKEEYPVYRSSLQAHTPTFHCLHYSIFDRQDKQRLENAFGMKDDHSCAYRVELIKYKINACNNPAVKSVGSDFNGYVRVEVKKGFSSCLKVQSDYKHDMDAAFQRVLAEISLITDG